jgi:hypothetical protein
VHGQLFSMSINVERRGQVVAALVEREGEKKSVRE